MYLLRSIGSKKHCFHSCSNAIMESLGDHISCEAGLNHSYPGLAEFEFTSRAYGASLVGLFFVSAIFHYISWTQSLWKVC